MNYKLHRDTMSDFVEFMKSIRGSFYNAAYITCNDCPNKDDCKTNDFIFTPGYMGKPLILHQSDVILLAHDIEPNLYRFILKSRDFIDFYGYYICWESSSDKECPLPKLALKIEREVVSNSDNKFLKIGKTKE